MNFISLFLSAGRLWFRKEADQYAAALAYFVPFALTPLLLISITWVGLLVGRERLVDLLTQWGIAIDPELPTIMTSALMELENRSDEYIVPIVAVAFFSVMIIVAINSLTAGIHKLWGVERTGWLSLFMRYGRAVFAILLIQFYFVCLIIINGAVTWIENISPLFRMEILQPTLFLVITIFCITFVYRILPLTTLPFLSCLSGAVVAGGLFLGLRAFVTAHVVTAPAVTLYGAASIVIMLLIWFYAVGSIILYGAAFAKVHADKMKREN
jgi:membrane protein